ncbi:GerAB/ArcD/ProY family transporter [Paenibacillus sp. S150]|uniref:GerAB/ArcD/ProY family transporter n=1 Tax=Paenibacillus sp. S150 TaxID=2749826 RepID=UPI001C569FDF|nr:GerAB/ArcD/ProY family transporter [Paenibacillus sp. S150]MBW4080665.1 GerAB/ArcD/ProY family transporter [Paenibacillus sp. S150]
MFTRSDDKITTTQAALFLTNTVLGAGILTLPRGVTEAVKTPDAWMSVLLGGGIVMLVILLMVKLSQQFPGKTIYQYSQRIAGTAAGGFLCMLLIAYFIITAGFEIRVFVEITIFFLLEGTPIWAIAIPFIWVGGYLVFGGINSISRVYQIISPISIFILILCYCLSIRLFDVNHLRPVLSEGILPVIKGLKSTVLIFSGCEVVMTLTAFMQHPEHAVKAMLVGISVPLFLYLLTVVMVIGGLSIDTAITSTWPTIDLIRSFEISGFFFERLEFPLLVIWMMQMFCNFCSFFFNASLGISQIFKLKLTPVIFALMPLIFIVTMIPVRMNDVFALGDAIGKMGIILFLLLPVLLSAVLIFRKKGLKQNV